ncbi:DUF7935 family protein [Catalinimonas niigatensis]|uniref:DUF7935 family protein n=1 Tax=Catalinimonas niigatensis TaxID=1397264 RepID=UPI002666C72F|nr:hypothetical protein [Catalinimonas niigatensis]WPP48048.1 hypothetical protein PZB72_15330 [Catalinimonas niigatensis]
MEIVIEFAKLILPAAIVLYAMYLTVKSFLDKEVAQKMIDIKTQNASAIIPTRLQAYERLTLLLERITPNNLVFRLNNSEYSAKEFHQVLIANIREEFNHNLSQQVYVSDEVWSMTKNAMEDVILGINQAAQSLDNDARSIDLGRKIIDQQIQSEQDAISQALSALKNEVRENF